MRLMLIDHIVRHLEWQNEKLIQFILLLEALLKTQPPGK